MLEANRIPVCLDGENTLEKKLEQLAIRRRMCLLEPRDASQVTESITQNSMILIPLLYSISDHLGHSQCGEYDRNCPKCWWRWERGAVVERKRDVVNNCEERMNSFCSQYYRASIE